MVSTTDLHWLAGLLEGEGCFSVSKSSRKRTGIRTMLSMKDEDVVRRAHALFGYGNVRQGKDGMWWWDTSGWRSGALMLMLYPYLGERRQKRIAELLRGWMGQGERGHHYRDSTHCKRGHLFSEENTRYRKDGKGRSCRACERSHYEERKRREAALSPS